MQGRRAAIAFVKALVDAAAFFGWKFIGFGYRNTNGEPVNSRISLSFGLLVSGQRLKDKSSSYYYMAELKKFMFPSTFTL